MWSLLDSYYASSRHAVLHSFLISLFTIGKLPVIDCQRSHYPLLQKCKLSRGNELGVMCFVARFSCLLLVFSGVGVTSPDFFSDSTSEKKATSRSFCKVCVLISGIHHFFFIVLCCMVSIVLYVHRILSLSFACIDWVSRKASCWSHVLSVSVFRV